MVAVTGVGMLCTSPKETSFNSRVLTSAHVISSSFIPTVIEVASLPSGAGASLFELLPGVTSVDLA